jgi:hypothetical protein
MVYVGWVAAVTSPTLAIALVSSVLLLDVRKFNIWVVVTFTIGILVLGAYGLLVAVGRFVAQRFRPTAQSRDVFVPSVLPSGLAAITGGVLLVAHGVVMMMWNDNLDVLPLTLLLFAVALVGLRGRLHKHVGLAGMTGGLLAYFALAATLTENLALLLMWWDEARFWPLHVAGLQLGLLAIILALVLLGLATFRGRVLPPGWRAVPLAVSLLWIGLLLLGEWAGDVISPYREISLGFVPAGLAWMVLGYVIGFIGNEERAAQPITSPPRSP